MHNAHNGEEATAPQTFGQWLKMARKGRGWSQDLLAAKAECSKSYISQLERDISFSRFDTDPRPSERTVDKFAEVLGLDSAVPRMLVGYAPKGSNQAGATMLISGGLDVHTQMVSRDGTMPQPAETAERLRAEAKVYQNVANQLCAAADFIDKQGRGLAGGS